MFYDVFDLLCQKAGVSKNKALLSMGLSNSLAIKWRKTGATPDGKTLAKIAEYFSISVDYLLGTGQNNTPTAADDDGLQKLLADERTLLDGYRTMTDGDKQMMQDFMRRLRNAD